eukprot:CAMPEP_0167740830 /NCGR_PEP_ID=MMETSP0110_2-20121227/513_1 /TAXON_ID=629695 /ORGANISM="Gymnochlora sp., Strain CCMP2014" /LENGTH=116 /DNA_ID=CAMNT_0007624803 /DNA_START=628 /DNA_END=978 /DNA_ORIENTATION=-
MADEAGFMFTNRYYDGHDVKAWLLATGQYQFDDDDPRETNITDFRRRLAELERLQQADTEETRLLLEKIGLNKSQRMDPSTRKFDDNTHYGFGRMQPLAMREDLGDDHPYLQDPHD